MKLRNKKTGEIKDFKVVIHELNMFNSLAELDKEWEDYEEPIVYWLINPLREKQNRIDGNGKFRIYNDEEIAKFEEAGFLYKTEEEAKKAVEKLKAWKRLKDKGFKFTGWEDLETLEPEESLLINRDVVDGTGVVGFRMENYEDCINDLELLFGGEE